MSAPRARLLIIDDDPELSSACRKNLEREGYWAVTESTAEAGIATAKSGQFDVVVTDLHSAGLDDGTSKDGFRLIREVRAVKPELPIILMTGDVRTEYAIEAMKLGAFDYITKPFESKELIELIEQAVAATRLVSEPSELGRTSPVKDAIIGHSRIMQSVYKDIGRYAASTATVLIRGETGTGKELVARALHRHSERQGLFIPVNCTALPESLLESELFGHEEGAFTGAKARRFGRFEQANHGTLFLDEIGDMQPNTQVKLLRVLQEKAIQRLGGKEFIPVNVRILAATHQDLEAGIAAKSFREDLYYRLDVAVIRLPPLRERSDDIPELVDFFLQRHAAEMKFTYPSITPAAIDYLKSRPWPGNVRELENAICKGLLLARGHPITPEFLKSSSHKPPVVHPSVSQSINDYISDLLTQAQQGRLENAEAALTWDIEYELYRQVFARTEGNQARAAKLLGVSRPTMREKLKLYGLR